MTVWQLFWALLRLVLRGRGRDIVFLHYADERADFLHRRADWTLWWVDDPGRGEGFVALTALPVRIPAPVGDAS